ncbi:hypothetical protein D3C79_573990 [compost metagenome]
MLFSSLIASARFSIFSQAASEFLLLLAALALLLPVSSKGTDSSIALLAALSTSIVSGEAFLTTSTSVASSTGIDLREDTFATASS